MEIHVRLDDAELLAGAVAARGVSVTPAAAELARQIDELLARRAGEDFPPTAVKEAIRGLLRRRGFKPAGRNKPASEYLAQAAREGRFPRINNLVDINNLLSLDSGLPISLLDLEAVGSSAELRYGQAGERYIFNSAGQEIDVQGLICVCRADSGGLASIPLGNPIKDSMAGKLKAHTTGVLGIVYGSTKVIDETAMGELLTRFAQLLKEFGGAGEAEWRVVRG
jgi:DNA/RNA-binding domain of Phe-tRNA-synthetase-like protein